MVLNLKVKNPLKDVKISRVVLISGILTFLYCVEFCIGIRTVYYTFKVWGDSAGKQQDRTVSWRLCLACLSTATVSTLTVNILSALWEQKQLQVREKQKNATRFVLHLMVGGMLWRYASLWCVKTKEFQKEGALLLTMIKFIFTQTFTVPMVIVHISVLDNLEELIYVSCSIFCISINLILMCTTFSWCSKEVEDLKKWDYETLDLVPLIFQYEPPAETEQNGHKDTNSTDKSESQPKQKCRCGSKNLEIFIIKTLVFFQTFGFSFGRLLALGILIKLAGIYTVSIMFLQILVSVIYLKFQVPILVSDSLPKWRQLCRLAFMSYILIFEWHLNRDPKTGYDFSSNMKHSIFYYCVAAVESVFYLITWTITTNYALMSEPIEVKSHHNTFCRVILTIGSMALVFSLTIHFILLFWRSRTISVFFYSVQRRYETAKLRLSKYGYGKNDDVKEKESPKRSKIDISSPILFRKDENNGKGDNTCNLEKHNSYKDLREPVDEEIEIYSRMNDKTSKSCSDIRSIEEKVMEQSASKTFVHTLDQELHREINTVEKTACDTAEETGPPAKIEVTESNISMETEDEMNKEYPVENSQLRSKITNFSGSIGVQIGKVTTASKKVAGSLMERIQKKKEQLQSLRNNSSADSNQAATPVKGKSSMKKSKTDANSNCTVDASDENHDNSEGYFVGDSRGYQDESLQTVKSISKQVSFSNDTSPESQHQQRLEDGPFPASDVTHTFGDSPCLCYVCKTLGEGRFRRRRSSSVPSADRKMKDCENQNGESESMSRYVSNPNMFSVDCDDKKGQSSKISVLYSPKRFHKSVLNLSQLSLDKRIEHYV